MKTISGISGIVGNIMASHDGRMKSRKELSEGAAEMLGRFRQERADANIKGCLKEGDKVRLAGFGKMMSGINNGIGDICRDVSSLSTKTQAMMKEYQSEHKWMAVEWAAMKADLLKKGRTSQSLS